MAVITIGWTDATGAATLSNLKTDPGNRLYNWTPALKPIGPVAHALGTGARYMFEFRNDETVSFEIRAIPNTELSLMQRLQLHLMRGNSVTLTTDNVLFADFVTCTLAPDTTPEISFSDNVFLEYTFAVTLLAGTGGVGSPGSGGGGGGGGGGFNPVNIPDIYLWLKADALTGYSNNDAVAPWYDSSGLGNNAPNVIHTPLSPNTPQYKSDLLNGLPVVLFPVTGINAQGAQVESPLMPAASGRTIIVVARRLGSDVADASFFGLGDANNRLYEGSASFGVTNFQWTWGTPAKGLGGDVREWSMITINGNASTAKAYMNGTQVGSSFDPADSLIGARKVVVGGYDATAGGDNANCQFAEVFVYNRELENAEMVNVHGYLNTKWALGF